MNERDGITEFAPAKVNLHLDVLGKRRDGFHEILTVMETISLGDQVHVVAASEGGDLTVSANRGDVPDGEANLAHKIVRAAEAELERSLPARIHIEKALPPGTGLGAGSSDAAAALRGVLRLHQIELAPERQRAIAARVGSDVPFFVEGGTALCIGRGEIVHALPVRGERHYVIVTGAPPAPTGEVYGALKPSTLSAPPIEPLLKAICTEADGPATESLFNRLEEAAVAVVPEIGRMRKQIASAAPEAPRLSGSGSAFFLCTAEAAEATEIAAKITEKVKGAEARVARTHALGPQSPAS